MCGRFVGNKDVDDASRIGMLCGRFDANSGSVKDGMRLGQPESRSQA